MVVGFEPILCLVLFVLDVGVKFLATTGVVDFLFAILQRGW